MKCCGAESRGLLPVVHHIVREMLCDDGDGSIKVGTQHLVRLLPVPECNHAFRGRQVGGALQSFWGTLRGSGTCD